MMTYEYAIQKAQGFRRSAQQMMDKASSGRNTDAFRDTLEYMAEQCAYEMVCWYHIARRLARGENVHLWEIPE